MLRPEETSPASGRSDDERPARRWTVAFALSIALHAALVLFFGVHLLVTSDVAGIEPSEETLTVTQRSAIETARPSPPTAVPTVAAVPIPTAAPAIARVPAVQRTVMPLPRTPPPVKRVPPPAQPHVARAAPHRSELSKSVPSAPPQLTKITALAPVLKATPFPSPRPTAPPTAPPATSAPRPIPTLAPTPSPTAPPTVAPTVPPTLPPTAAPTRAPTAAPTRVPTASPTRAPTVAPLVATPRPAPTVAPPTARPATARPATAPPATVRPATAPPATARPATAAPSTARPATAAPATSRPAAAVTARPAPPAPVAAHGLPSAAPRGVASGAPAKPGGGAGSPGPRGSAGPAASPAPASSQGRQAALAPKAPGPRPAGTPVAGNDLANLNARLNGLLPGGTVSEYSHGERNGRLDVDMIPAEFLKKVSPPDTVLRRTIAMNYRRRSAGQADAVLYVTGRKKILIDVCTGWMVELHPLGGGPPQGYPYIGPCPSDAVVPAWAGALPTPPPHASQ